MKEGEWITGKRIDVSCAVVIYISPILANYIISSGYILVFIPDNIFQPTQ